MSSPTLAVGALLALMLTLQPAHAQSAQAPRQLIEKLGVEMRQILEARKPDKVPEDAERQVAEQITALIHGSPGHPSLTETDEHGRTPLMLAASGAYPLVVQALLADPAVKLGINARNEAGATAWMEASFAPTLTLAACQPGVLTRERSLLLPPYLRRMAHLLKARGAAIGAITRQLEEAGAVAQPEEAKKAWLARCPNATAELRAALAEGALMPTLIKHAVSRQGAFNKAALDNIASVPARPPQDMKFVNVAKDPAQASISPSCRRALPLLDRFDFDDWTGEILFKVTFQTRAGVVEGADFELSGDPPRAKVVDALREAILGALSAYECQGDHVFEQEFQFEAK